MLGVLLGGDFGNSSYDGNSGSGVYRVGTASREAPLDAPLARAADAYARSRVDLAWEALRWKTLAYEVALVDWRWAQVRYVSVVADSVHARPAYDSPPGFVSASVVPVVQPAGNCPYWSLAAGYGGWTQAWWCATVACESGHRPWADENPPYVGLMQVENGSYDPATNIAQGWAKYQSGGPAHWPYCGYLVAV